MNVVDIIILIFFAFGALLGFKRGFTRQLVSLIGVFAIIVLSFILKNPISILLYKNLPFFNFGGIFKDITVLNILVYEVVAFFIVFFILLIIFRILLKVTKIFERVLTMTIILGIPSKLIGMVLGIIEALVYSFIALYILSLPTLNMNYINDSKVANTILNKTPILHNICDKTLSVFNEVIELKEEYENTDNMKEFNQKTLNIMIENKVITKENAQELINSGKIKDINVE